MVFVRLLSLKTIVSKASQYSRELGLCFKIGCDLKSRVALAADTLLFHIANGLGVKQVSAGEKAKCRRIRLRDRAIYLWVRTYGGDVFVFHEVFLSEVYRIPASWCREVDSVVDLGANVGFTTLYFAQYFPRANYVCVEPDPNNAAILRRNVSWLGGQARVIEGAVSDQSGYASFDASGQSWGGQLHRNQPSGVSVRCYTMNELFASCGLSTIDVLKVDIEGAEEHLFGSQNEWLSKVKLIIVELHGHYTMERFQRHVHSMGFKVLPPSRDHNHMIFALSSDTFRAAIKPSANPGQRPNGYL